MLNYKIPFKGLNDNFYRQEYFLINKKSTKDYNELLAEINKIGEEFIITFHKNMNENIINDYILVLWEFSSKNIPENSIFFKSEFIKMLCSIYSQYNDFRVLAMCTNIMIDDNSSLNTINLFFQGTFFHNFVETFDLQNADINNFEFFLIFRNISKILMKHYSNFLISFCKYIPVLIESLQLYQKDDIKVLKLQSLRYLGTNNNCLAYELSNDIVNLIVNSIFKPLTVKSFCEYISIINLLHDHSIEIKEIQDIDFLSLVSQFIETANSKQLKILVKFLKHIVVNNGSLFFSSDILNQLNAISCNSDHKTKMITSFFFAQSFPIIFQYLYKPKQNNIKSTEYVNENANEQLIQQIIHLIIDICFCYKEEKLLFCLNIIKTYAEIDPTIANYIIEQTDLVQILEDHKNEMTNDVFIFSQILIDALSKFQINHS